MGNIENVDANKIKELYESTDGYPILIQKIWEKYWALRSGIHKKCNRKFDCHKKTFDARGYYYTDRLITHCGCSSPIKQRKQIISHFTDKIKKLSKYSNYIELRYSNTWGLYKPADYNQLLDTIKTCINTLNENIEAIKKTIIADKIKKEKENEKLKREKYVNTLVALEL